MSQQIFPPVERLCPVFTPKPQVAQSSSDPLKCCWLTAGLHTLVCVSVCVCIHFTVTLLLRRNGVKRSALTFTEKAAKKPETATMWLIGFLSVCSADGSTLWFQRKHLAIMGMFFTMAWSVWTPFTSCISRGWQDTFYLKNKPSLPVTDERRVISQGEWIQ